MKFCRIAEGAADVYPRLGPTSEWDIAAGEALLSAAGGVVRTPEGDVPDTDRSRAISGCRPSLPGAIRRPRCRNA